MKKNYTKIVLIPVAVVVVIASSFYFWQKNYYHQSENIVPTRNTITKATDKSWEGEWVLEDAIQDYSGTLTIKNQIANSFSFSLDTYNGAHMGNVDGEAKIVDASASSIVGDASEKEYQCQVDFSKNRDKIEIKTTNGDCSYFRGARAFFAGSYIKNGTVEESALKDIVRVYGGGGPDETDLHIFKNDEELNAFQKLVGNNHVSLFTSSFQLVFREDDTEHLNARVYTGGVAGLYTISEGIIIIGIGSPTKIWAAAIDDDVVRYFTNVSGYTNNLPETIEKWRERFQNKKVIFMNGQ